jgi:2-polyprenyl-6-methoxyphenol hydroxylase-like FAD-dependent oxidoreductase
MLPVSEESAAPTTSSALYTPFFSSRTRKRYSGANHFPSRPWKCELLYSVVYHSHNAISCAPPLTLQGPGLKKPYSVAKRDIVLAINVYQGLVGSRTSGHHRLAFLQPYPPKMPSLLLHNYQSKEHCNTCHMSTESPRMSKQTISIVGAGLSGLTLGRCLKQRGISSVLYQRGSSPAPLSYGITLYSATYTPLLKALDVDEQAFKSRVAVDADIGGLGKISNAALGTASESVKTGGNCFRANRGKLEEWLREGLDVRWEHVLQNVELSSSKAPTLCFANGEKVQSDVVVGADGPHSGLRNSLLPESQPTILPYVVFNGKRRIDRAKFEEKVSRYMKESAVINLERADVRLNVSISEYTTERVSISWTYSRQSRGGSDALHSPHRELSMATVIPEQLFEELENLSKSGLPQPFAEILEPSILRKDRILHWLMRTTLVAKDDLQNWAQNGVVLIGDAAHALPIVGGNGANVAIQDAASLAAQISKDQETNERTLNNWIDHIHPTWSQSVQYATENIHTLHSNALEKL